MSETARILLAEDDRILRKAGEVTLRRNGYSVIVAVDGEEALAKAREHRPDLILLDVMMPKLTGFEVLDRLRDDSNTRGIPVIMLSNLGQESDMHEAVERGARAYVVKSSVGPEKLAERIAEVLASREHR
jgi:CheY-like chemotaxis protein